jgi:transposase
MPRYKPFDYKQTVMLPLSLENQLLPGTFEFALHYLMESRVDLSKFEAKLKNDDTGSSAYHPKILLKIILYGYSQGIVSSRKLERACKEHVIFMALSCLAMPDHSTIASFVDSMKEEIELLFVNILLICEEMNLLGHTEFALDGLKLPSNASKEYSGTHSDLAKKKKKLEAKIAQLLGEQIRTDKVDSKSEIGNKTMCDKTEAVIKKLRAKAEKIERFLAENEPKIGKSGKEIQSNITDNESARMKTSHGVIQGYNAQALVDEKHQVIVYAGASSSGQDYDQLSSVIDRAKENVKVLGFDENYFENTVMSMDSNYHSKENLEKGKEERIDAYIPDVRFRQRDPRFQSADRHKPEREEEKYKLEDFHYDEKRDCYICPVGKVLTRYAGVHKIRNTIFRRYAADEGDCANCSLKGKCLQTGEAKRRHLAIAIGKHEPSLSEEMIKKIDTPEGRKIYARRMKIVEPVFANIRIHKRLDRFTLRGKTKVNIQWLLYCIVHNIGKITVFGAI